MPQWLDNCVTSMLADWDADPDKRPKATKKGQSAESQAYAICTAQYKEKFGHAPSREDVVQPALRALQIETATEEVKLTFSDDEKRQVLQRAINDMYGDGYSYGIWEGNWWITAVYDTHVVVYNGQHDRMYAIPYTIVDRHNVELGDPEEVVAAHVTEEVETFHILLFEGWLPEGMTQTELSDGDFAWLSDAYQKASKDDRAKMNKRQHRKLPYKVHGKVSVEGWLAAWKAARWTTYLRPSFRGGPSRDSVLEKLKSDKPSKVKLDKDGHATLKEAVGEAVDGDILLEVELTDFLVEEATESERQKFAVVFSGNVIPAPNIKQGVWSANRRLYPPAAVEETYQRSIKYLTEGGVATVYTSHAAAERSSGKLPIGRVLSYDKRADGAVKFRAGIVDTAEGRDTAKLLEAEVLNKVSLRTHNWESDVQEVEELGICEVMSWCVIQGIDFAAMPGLTGTNVKKEEQMELSTLTLEELRTARPDLVEELVQGMPQAQPEGLTEEVQLKLAILEASNTGIGSVVARMLTEQVKSADEIPAVIEEVRQKAITEVYGNRGASPASNLKGSSTPAPEPKAKTEELNDMQKSIVENAGGNA